MRKSFIIAAVLVAALTSCQKELQEISEAGGCSVRATREALAGEDTKASIETGGTVKWMSGDQIAIYNGKGGWNKFTTEDDGVTSATFKYEGFSVTMSGYAYFPYIETSLPSYDETEGALTVTYPESYEWVENQTNVPMLATFDDASKGLSFKHLGGIVKVTINNVPAGEGALYFWANGKQITGPFEASLNAEGSYQVNAGVSTDNDEVAITFNNATKQDVMDFYIPVPAGEGYVLNVRLVSGKIDTKCEGTKAYTINRKTILKMPALTISSSSVDGGTDTAVSNVYVTEALDANSVVALPSTSADVHVYFQESQSQAITLAYNNLLDAEKPSNVYVHADGKTFAGKLTIALENSHVELLSGTYTAIDAITGATTLVVGDKAAVNGTLTVDAGSLVVNGSMADDNSKIVMNAAYATLEVGPYDASSNGYVKSLTLNKSTSAEISGIVETINASAASSVLVKSTGRVITSGNDINNKKNLTVRVETDSETEKEGEFLDNSTNATNASKSLTIIDIAGLQSKIDNAIKDKGDLQLKSNYEAADTVKVKSDLTIDFAGKEITAVIKVEKGAKLTLKGSTGALKPVGEKAILANEGTVVLEGGLTLTGAVENKGEMTLTAMNNNSVISEIENSGELKVNATAANATTGVGAVRSVKNTTTDAVKAFTVGAKVALPEVVNAQADGTTATEAYVNSAATFKTAAADAAVKKIILTAAVSKASAITLGAADFQGVSKRREVVIDLNGYNYATNSNVNAFTLENAKVTITNGKYNSAEKTGAATVTASGSGNALELLGSENSFAAGAYATSGEAYTAVKLDAGVKLTSGSGKSIVLSDNQKLYGIAVESGADLLKSVAVTGGSDVAISYAPDFNLVGGSVAGITGEKYAVWTLKGVAVTDGVNLTKGVMTLESSMDGDTETTTIAGGTAVTFSGTTLTVNGGKISSTTTAIKLTAGTLTIGDKAVVTGSTTGVDFNSANGTLEVGGSISGATAIKLTAGTLTIGDKAVVTGSTTALDIDGGTLYVNGGEITGDTNALDISSSPTVTIKGGAFSGAIIGSITSNFIKKGNTATFDNVGFMTQGEDNATVTIKLIKDAKLESNSVSVADKKIVALDLNGWTVGSNNDDGTFKVAYGGTLTISDSSEGKTGQVTNTGANSFSIKNDGTVELLGGEYNCLSNQGIMTIGSEETPNGVKAASSAENPVILNGYASSGDHTSNSNVAIPTLTIWGGAFTASGSVTSVVENAIRGDLQVKGGTFSNSNASGKVIYNHNVAEITGGKFYAASYDNATALESKSFKKTGQYIVDDYQIGKTTITGGYFQGKLEKTNVNDKGEEATTDFAKILISGGEYSCNPGAFLVSGYRADETFSDLYNLSTYKVVEDTGSAE